MKNRYCSTKISFPLTVALSGIFVAAPLTSADQSRFEAASVKRTDRCSVENSIDPGIVSLRGDPLSVVLAEAFKVKMDDIVGPSWLSADCFEIVASIPAGATRDQVPAMLQALLAERFKLATHKEARQRSGYALLMDKHGPKFKESGESAKSGPTAGQVRFGAGPGAFGIKGSMTMTSLARFVSNRLGSPVEDLTGLPGRYDIDISWAADPSLERSGPFASASAATHPDSAVGAANPAAAPAAGIFAAFRDSLGLKLEARKQQVEVLVIDRVERVPTGN